MTGLPRVSVLLVTKNGARSLAEVLTSVGQQHGAFQLEEIIAVDSGSRDASLDILRAACVRLVTIPAQEFGHGTTRNLAASHAHGDYLVFLTQDATPADADWLANAAGTLYWPSRSIAGVPIAASIPRPHCHPMEWRRIVEDELSGRSESCLNSKAASALMRTIRPPFISSQMSARCCAVAYGSNSLSPRWNLPKINSGQRPFLKPVIRPPIERIRWCITSTAMVPG